MATTKRIIADSGSEEVRLTRTQLNELLAVVEAVIAAASEASFGDFTTACEAIDVTGLRELVASRELPAAPSVD